MTGLLDALLTGKADAIWRLPNGTFAPHEPSTNRQALLPGSFNPLHAGHTELRHVASAVSGLDVSFELSVRNVDKPTLTKPEIARRLEPMQYPVLLTNAPTFADKGRCIPRTNFVVGVDTAERIVDPKYYGNSESSLLSSLQFLRDHECQFLVAGRFTRSNFQTVAEVNIPTAFQTLFQAIPEHQFRNDISSTQLRRS